MEQTKTEEVKSTGKVASLKRRKAPALTQTRFGSKEMTAQVANLAHPFGRPLGRSQHLLSSPNQDGSHQMHRATEE
jgi:hypothetical protein